MNVRIKIQLPMKSKARRFIISNLLNPFGKKKDDSVNCFQLSRSCQRDSVKLVKETG